MLHDNWDIIFVAALPFYGVAENTHLFLCLLASDIPKECQNTKLTELTICHEPF